MPGQIHDSLSDWLVFEHFNVQKNAQDLQYLKFQSYWFLWKNIANFEYPSKGLNNPIDINKKF